MTKLAILLALAACQGADPTFEPSFHRWDPARFPLRVTHSSEIPEADARAAVGFFPKCIALYAGTGDSGDVQFDIGNDTGDEDLGAWDLVLAPSGEILRAHAYVKQPIRPYLHLGSAHELGHILGLAHDRQSTSIMHPEITDAFSATPYKTLTSADDKALRETYCR